MRFLKSFQAAIFGRRRRQGDSGVVFAYSAGNAVPAVTFARTGTATYTALIDDTVFNWSPAFSNPSATAVFARSGTATFTADV